MVLYYKVNFISFEIPIMVQKERGYREDVESLEGVAWCGGYGFLLFFRFKVNGTNTLAQIFYLHFKEICRRTKIISLKI